MPVVVKTLQVNVRGSGKQTARKLVRQGTLAVLAKAKELTPTRTGNLRSHNKFRLVETATQWRGEVYNDAPYAAWVHDKTKPHVILPRRKTVLRFEIDGVVVYAKKVKHPGTKGQPWLTQAQRAVAPRYGFAIKY